MVEQQVAAKLKKSLLEKIEKRTARMGVIGLGYVGLPLAEVFSRAGLRVTGFDIHEGRVATINEGKNYIEDLTDEQIKTQVDAGRLNATTDFDAVREMDVVIICVPTPLRKTHDPDISYVVSAAEQIRQRLVPGQLIILESTTYPGTTEEVIQPMLEQDGMRTGEHFFLAFSPERVDPSNKTYKTENTPKVVGGTTASCCEVADALYRTAIPQVHVVSSARAAEMVKLLENTFRMVNIGLVNEIALVCEKLGLDVWEVIDAAATKPFGYMPFYPGPGLGGHCIPIDPHYLSWKLRSLNFVTRFIDLASEVNRGMPNYVTQKLARLLNEHAKAVNGSRVLVVGVAYKKNTRDTRESPALDVMHLLREQGANLTYFDPWVEELTLDDEVVTRVPLDQAQIEAADAVLILTDHDGVDYDLIAKNAKLVFDTRNALSHVSDKERIAKL